VGDGVQLGPLGTAATNRPIVPALNDYDGEICEMIGKGDRSTHRKPAPVPLCPPQTIINDKQEEYFKTYRSKHFQNLFLINMRICYLFFNLFNKNFIFTTFEVINNSHRNIINGNNNSSIQFKLFTC
jgi:hypothetical protein